MGGALRLVFVEASKGVAPCLVGMTQELGPDRQPGIARFTCIGKTAAVCPHVGLQLVFASLFSRQPYSHYSVKSVPVISTVDITGPKNAPQAPRERGMWTAITFMVDLLNLFSGRINLHKS